MLRFDVLVSAIYTDLAVSDSKKVFVVFGVGGMGIPFRPSDEREWRGDSLTFRETVLGFERSGLLNTLILLLTVKKHHQMPTNPIMEGVWKEFAHLHVKHIDGGCSRERLAIDPIEG